ncbi:MAG: DinB family protein [Acidobacteriaceae bacterium]
MATTGAPLPEPWLRGTLTEIPAVIRAVLHALELAREDAERWCGELTGLELNTRPMGLPPVAFHLRHISGSVDRLLTYAEGRELSEEQVAEMKREAEPAGALPRTLLLQFGESMERAAERIRAFAGADLEAARFVGRKRLPTSVGGLLVHVADHTQRHTGQMVTTAKLVRASTLPGSR